MAPSFKPMRSSGSSRSIVGESGADGADMLFEASVAVAVIAWLPPVRVEAMIVQAPEPLAVVDPVRMPSE